MAAWGVTATGEMGESLDSVPIDTFWLVNRVDVLPIKNKQTKKHNLSEKQLNTNKKNRNSP